MSRLFKAHKPKAPAKRPDPVAATPPRTPTAPAGAHSGAEAKDKRPKEIGGPAGPEPTRYGDWERKGICVDF